MMDSVKIYLRMEKNPTHNNDIHIAECHLPGADAPISVRSDNAPLPGLCRKLIKQGLGASTTAYVYRGELLVFEPFPIGLMAGRTYSERKGYIKIEKWRDTMRFSNG